MCRYWQVFQRLVLLGWTDDARDLLFAHSEVHADEEQLSRYEKVKAQPCPSLFTGSLLHWLDMPLTC